MAEQRYWLELGQLSHGTPYAKGVISSDYWLQIALADKHSPVVIEVKVNPKTGDVSAHFRKNDILEAA